MLITTQLIGMKNSLTSYFKYYNIRVIFKKSAITNLYVRVKKKKLDGDGDG